ncbi:hypothetical protein I4U23_007166 [Adineta vaga]|nr:hypothetical protein I4U23_007166 [Adineta vaga]
MGNRKSMPTMTGIAAISSKRSQHSLRIKIRLCLTQSEISTWHDKFFHDNPDGRLNKSEFRRLFRLLRQEPPERLENICDHVFRAFDVDGNGYVEFGEFLLGFAICSRGDLRSRLDYAFECYDLDSNGYITEDEIEPVLRGMYTLLGIKHVQDYPPDVVAKDLMKKLDTSRDGRVTKDEFIHFLMKEGIYRNTVNPFH